MKLVTEETEKFIGFNNSVNTFLSDSPVTFREKDLHRFIRRLKYNYVISKSGRLHWRPIREGKFLLSPSKDEKIIAKLILTNKGFLV